MTRPAAPGETSSEFATRIYELGFRRLRARSESARRALLRDGDRRQNYRVANSVDALVREVERLQAIVAANQREEK